MLWLHTSKSQPLLPCLPPASGITAPTEYGGLAAGYSEHCIAMEVSSRRLREHKGMTLSGCRWKTGMENRV